MVFVGPFLKVLCKVICWLISTQKRNNLNERKSLERGFGGTPDLDNDAIPNHKMQRGMNAKPELDMIKSDSEMCRSSLNPIAETNYQHNLDTEHDEQDDGDYLEITDDYIIKSPSSSLASYSAYL